MLQRRLEKQQCCEKSDEFTDREQTCLRFVQGRPDDKRDAEHRDHLRDGSCKALHLDSVERRTANGLVDLFKAGFFKGITSRNLHDALCLVSFLDAREHETDRFLTLLHDYSDAPGDHLERDDDERTDHEGDKRQLPVLPEKKAEERNDLQRVTDQNDQGTRRSGERNVCFIDEFRADGARRVVLISICRPRHDPIVEFRAKGNKHGLTHFRHDPGRGHGAKAK